MVCKSVLICIRLITCIDWCVCSKLTQLNSMYDVCNAWGAGVLTTRPFWLKVVGPLSFAHHTRGPVVVQCTQRHALALSGGPIAGRRGQHLGKTASADSCSEPAGPRALELQVDEQASSAPRQPLFLVELRSPGVQRAGSLVVRCKWLEKHQPPGQLLQCGTRLLSWRLWKGTYLFRTQVDRGPS